MTFIRYSSLLSVAAALAFGPASLAHAQNDPAGHIRILASELHWQGSPLLPNGVQVAPLVGNPKSAGLYAQRVRIPANTRIAPHSHPDSVRTGTIISGTLYLGFGETFNEAELKPMPPGAFFTEPAGAPHFALTRDEEVIVHSVAIGPSGTKYVQAPDSAK